MLSFMELNCMLGRSQEMICVMEDVPEAKCNHQGE